MFLFSSQERKTHQTQCNQTTERWLISAIRALARTTVHSPSKQQANIRLQTCVRLHTGVWVPLNALALSYGRIQRAGGVKEKEWERESYGQKLNKLTFELQANETLNKAEMAGLEIQIDRPVWSRSEGLPRCTLGSLYFPQEGDFFEKSQFSKARTWGERRKDLHQSDTLREKESPWQMRSENVSLHSPKVTFGFENSHSVVYSQTAFLFKCTQTKMNEGESILVWIFKEPRHT